MEICFDASHSDERSALSITPEHENHHAVDEEPGIAVIIPVYNAGDDLVSCLTSLFDAGQAPSDIVLVDDDSTDGAAQSAAERHGTRYVRLTSGPHGPAFARNRGTREFTASDAYLFVDSDVSLQADALQRFRKIVATRKDIAAVFGSYDDRPTDAGWISQYKNLLHHYMHQTSRPDVTTFWSGCGLVRRAAFRGVGGFDEDFATASIEDIDLGTRLREAGHVIRLQKDILCRHHKCWTLKGWLKTDIMARALPWSRLIAERGEGIPDVLNLGWRERLSALVALGFHAGILFLAALTVFGAASVAIWALVAVIVGCIVMFALLQRHLLALFRRRQGTPFMLVAALLHSIYYVYSSLVFVGVRLTTMLR